MKTRILGICILTIFSVSAFAQDIETDDMYFNSKDRQKLREASAQNYAIADARRSDRRLDESADELNPTDSYSARTVNPEYSSRSNAETAQTDNEDYFVNNYQYQTNANLNRFNNNFNSWYNSSWYTRNYWGPSIYSWNSPFYGSYYNPWGNPWNDPFYRANYSSSFSYYWGNSWNYGWGYDNYWNYPRHNAWGWGSGWGPSYAFGYSSWYGPSWYGGGYPRVVVVNNNYGETGRKVVYGKRPVRSSTVVTNQYNTRTRTSSYDQGTSGRPNSGGRAASNSNEYYNKSWRYTSPASSTNSNNTYNSNTRTRSSSYSNDSNTQRNSSFGNSNNSYSTPSRSSSPSYNSGGSRSSSPAPSGGSNGRSRGSR